MEGGSTLVMTVETIVADVSTLLNTAVTAISGNAVLAAFLGLGLVGAAAGLFAKLKRSSR